MALKRLEFHDFANILPLMEGRPFDDFVEDIRENGIHKPIELLDGLILDGRNRYLALVNIFARRVPLGTGWGAFAGQVLDEDDLKPTAGIRWFTRFDPSNGDPLTYVWSQNVQRRQLDESQRAMAAARYARLGQGRPSKAKETAGEKPAPGPVSQAQAARGADVSERTIRRAKSVLDHGTPALQHAVEAGHLPVRTAAAAARMPAATQDKIAAAAEAGRANTVRTVVKQEVRKEREAVLGAKQHSLPDKRYGIIVADPAWEHTVWDETTGSDRAASNHYPTTALGEIMALDVGSIAADDSVLGLWTTVPHAAQAHKVMEAWGFEYKTQQIWRKIYPGEGMGMGYWGRIDHEILLIGTRGKPPAPAMGTQPRRSVFDAPVGEHSEKPDLFLEFFDFHFPSLPKIELNARRARPGWDAWGWEAPAAGETDEHDTLNRPEGDALPVAAGATAISEPAADNPGSGDVGEGVERQDQNPGGDHETLSPPNGKTEDDTVSSSGASDFAGGAEGRELAASPSASAAYDPLAELAIPDYLLRKAAAR